ncbi:MAG TPA: sodium:alanine symporter family protein [Candidatus Hydrogenedentes bacterium]|nr:sodium:alanine symporter family protein [Candidatus Hydrogenedentota bacterium]HPG67702.1 sodium:alanine symporter family protein [Candidatus Hydrogenedentota bacterium]
MQSFENLMNAMNGIVWGPIMIVLLVGTGIYLTIRLRFVQLRYLDHAVDCVLDRQATAEDQEGDITPFQALTAALSGTIGTGNIAGVATAIALGGPGAVFWMWVTALVGMATKMTCCSLAVRYRVVHEDGSFSGGPMYFLSRGLGLPWLGALFALFAGLASFGIGCAVQSNSVADAIVNLLPASLTASRIPATVPIVGGTLAVKPVIGIVLAFLVGAVILGGIKRIAQVAEKIVPIMCVIYIVGALAVLVRFAPAIPGAFAQIFRFALTPMAAGGGFVGMVVQRTMAKGVARGVFSNESGLGSAPMAHAAAKTNEMIRQGFIAMLGPFIDTIIICSMTALVIVVTGVWEVRDANGEMLYGPDGKGLPMRVEIHGKGVQVVGSISENPEPFLDENGEYYTVPTGASLTSTAFEAGLGRAGAWVVAIGIMLFAYSTMISWSYYGDRCWVYLLGTRSLKPYRYIFCVFVVIGTISGLDLVWTMADNLNALMAVPNLIGLLGLAGLVARETRDYLRRMDEAGTL